MGWGAEGGCIGDDSWLPGLGSESRVLKWASQGNGFGGNEEVFVVRAAEAEVLPGSPLAVLGGIYFFYECVLQNIYFCFIDYAKAFDCVDRNELWKILKEMGIPEHLTCLLRNLYAGQEATVRNGHGTTDWLQIGKGDQQGCILSP